MVIKVWVDMTLDRVVKYFLDTQCKKEDFCVIKSGKGGGKAGSEAVCGGITTA